MSNLAARIAGAPITWGVCELPGWGTSLQPERVLAEAAAIGLQAMELGPPAYLGATPAASAARLTANRLIAAGAFLAVVLHRATEVEASLQKIRDAAQSLAATAALAILPGGRAAPAHVLVLAADLGGKSYENEAELSGSEWATLVDTLERASVVAARSNVLVALHPHHGTAIAGAAQIEKLLDTSAVTLCLDTGHLCIGGADPLEVAQRGAARIGHVHLKDVDAQLAGRVRTGELGYRDAVAQGLYRPLGDGDARIAEVVTRLESCGYRGWYVIEQDTVLECEPPRTGGPKLDAEKSLRFLSTRVA